MAQAHEQQAQPGKTVKVHYQGTLPDGTVFDSSRGREPLEFTLGAGQVIAGFDKAVAGLAPGESRTATVPAAEAYGPRLGEMVLELPREQVPSELTVEVGQQLELRQEDGQTVPVTIADLSDETVTLDANHPLAGQDLTFEVELVEVV